MDWQSAEVRIKTGLSLILWAVIMSTLDAVMDDITFNSAIALSSFATGGGMMGAGLLRKDKAKDKPDEAIGKNSKD